MGEGEGHRGVVKGPGSGAVCGRQGGVWAVCERCVCVCVWCVYLFAWQVAVNELERRSKGTYS